MIKVLHIIQGYGGGVSSLVKNLIVASDKERIKQDVMSFTFENGEEFIKCLEHNGSKTFLMPRPRKDGYKAFKTFVLDVIKNGGYDVVHCHSDGWRSTIFKKLTAKAGIKLFCVHAHRTSNNPGFVQNNSVYLAVNRRISKKNADIKFTCGAEAAGFIYGDCDFITIPNGIDADKCTLVTSMDRNDLRKSLDIKDDELMLFHAGRFVVQKNHEYIIKIAEKLRDKGASFKILLAGTGDLFENVQSLIKEKSLENYVMLLGRRSDIYELMYAADCVILPSTSEGLPTVVMESQAIGTPCCTSDRVTHECDLGLGLVKFLNLDNIDAWIDALTDLKQFTCPSRAVIDDVFDKSAYTSTGSANRYFNTLSKQLKN